jgi:hypothetical protein
MQSSMKKYFILLVMLISSALSAQLNQSSQAVKQHEPETYKSIRAFSLLMHEGENYKVSQEINKQCEAFIEVMMKTEDVDLNVLFSYMRKYCYDTDQFDAFKKKEETITKCFQLPINWWFVNQALP